MANKARGFVEFDLGGRKVELSLGLGALAEIEDAFGVESFEDALNFGEKISARTLQKFLRAVLKGNGVAMDAGAEKYLSAMPVQSVFDLMSALMPASKMTQAEGEAKGDSRPLGGKSAGKRG